MISSIAAVSAILAVCFTGTHSASSSECRVSLTTDLHASDPPMILSVGTDSAEFVYPTTANTPELVVAKGSSVTLACPKKSNTDVSATTADGVLQWKDTTLSPTLGQAVVKCLGSDYFNLQDNSVKLANVSCYEKSGSTYNAILRAVDGGSCTNGELYEIGFVLDDDIFVRTVELCHDSDEDKTLWAHATIQAVNTKKTRFTGTVTSTFRPGILYTDFSMNKVLPYNLKNALATLTTLLGSETTAKKYVSSTVSDAKYLARGHLVANADKIYKSEKDSTYFYANVVPMWQQINAYPGNWFFVENYIRVLAAKRGNDLEVWAGGVGVAELEGVQIYLYNKSKIPVPKVLFKCVVDKTNEDGVCFLVVNNPYVTVATIQNTANGYIACEQNSMCNSLTSNYNDVTLGYLYCCSIKSFVTNNKAEVGLDDLQELTGYDTMSLVKLT